MAKRLIVSGDITTHGGRVIAGSSMMIVMESLLHWLEIWLVVPSVMVSILLSWEQIKCFIWVRQLLSRE